MAIGQQSESPKCVIAIEWQSDTKNSTFCLAQYDWMTGVPDNGKEWRKFRVIPRLHPLRLLLVLGWKQKGFYTTRGWRGSLPLCGGTFAQSYHCCDGSVCDRLRSLIASDLRPQSVVHQAPLRKDTLWTRTVFLSYLCVQVLMPKKPKGASQLSQSEGRPDNVTQVPSQDWGQVCLPPLCPQPHD